jgi:hypothetical protein
VDGTVGGSGRPDPKAISIEGRCSSRAGPSGASEIAVMTKAGHSSFATTRTYLHLAGTVFREEAERMERLALGSSTEPSTDLSESQDTSADLTTAEQAEAPSV